MLNLSYIFSAKDFMLEADFTLSVKFRTYKRNGPLLYLFSSQTSNGISGLTQYGSMILLELQEGNVSFYKVSFFSLLSKHFLKLGYQLSKVRWSNSSVNQKRSERIFLKWEQNFRVREFIPLVGPNFTLNNVLILIIL